MGVWFSGSEYPFLAWIARRGYKIDGSPGGVKVLKQGFGVDPLLDKQGDCISTKMYNEYWQIIDAGLTPSELVVFNEQGGTMLEDGLYVMESQLRDSVFVKTIASFVKVSMRGWEYARQNPYGVTNIVLANQRRMVNEIDKLLDSNNGKLDPQDYARTVVTLLVGDSAPGGQSVPGPTPSTMRMK